MKTHSPILISAQRRGRLRWLAIVGVFVTIVFTANVPAQTPAAPGGAAPERSAEELEKLVGRIALYPDDLVAIILPAATNPLQLVQADRFLDKRKADPKLPVDEKWDDAVKSLLNYPEVVKSMSADLDWTSELGEAVVEDQGDVLEAIQVFRRKTQAAGNLNTDAKQTVVVEKEVIKIVPSDPQVIYVPQYNPTTVVVYGGYSSWGYYPAPYPVYYYPYPPGAALATGLIWGAAVTAVWRGGHYAAHYGGHGNNNININRNTNINTGNINTGNRNQSGRGGEPAEANGKAANSRARSAAAWEKPTGRAAAPDTRVQDVRRRSRPAAAPSAVGALQAARRRWTVRAAPLAVARRRAQAPRAAAAPQCRAQVHARVAVAAEVVAHEAGVAAVAVVVVAAVDARRWP